MEQNRTYERNHAQKPNGNSRFAESVEAYTVHDLHRMEKTHERSRTVSLLIRCAAIAVCICILGYSVYMIASKVIDDRAAADAYNKLHEGLEEIKTLDRSKNLPEPNAMPTVLQMLNAEGNYEPYVPGQSSSEDRTEHYRVTYQKFLRAANNYENVYGWIYMTDTRVNYPIMKGTDNDYYLKHNFEGKEHSSGSIFADCNVSSNYYSNYNMVLYGHNMRNGEMFHSVKLWCSSAKIRTYLQTTQIEVYTREGIYIYKPFSYYIDSSNVFATVYFPGEDAYLNFLNSIYKKSNIRTNREYNAQSRICTLITCTNGSEGDSRFVVHGILDQFIPMS